MRLSRSKKFVFKYYRCKNKTVQSLFFGILMALIIAMPLVGCKREAPPEILVQKEDNRETEEIETATKRCLEIISLYEEIYEKAEKITSPYSPNQTLISQEVIDQIEILLIQQGFSVINSDSIYPDYLENSDSVYTFWEAISNHEDAEQEFISVSENGGLFYSFLQYSGGEKLRTGVVVEWNEENKPVIILTEYMQVIDWELMDSGDFYYQIYPSDRIYDDYICVRLKPMDQTLYDLTVKYFSPIGYLSNNMFVCDWSYEDYGGLSFNDLFEFFYKVRNNDHFYANQFEIIREPYFHINIPASLFEDTILEYFQISLEEFRKRSLYDREKDAYPWQEVSCDNLTYYPYVEPEVVGWKENEDGSITVTVNARCNDYKTNRLFTHEVVIRNLEDGDYQYLSNKIIYTSDIQMPPNTPRIQMHPAE
ncbi:DUF6070 family protein [Anaerotignum sp.]|uniref:DUF6070 family protein n=1 Tax=Anaerotignum sp. TaxID=2039241 RepID=UPI0028AB22D8|nr:DUF6070 family protein [Anaerotignum sp.]